MPKQPIRSTRASKHPPEHVHEWPNHDRCTLYKTLNCALPPAACDGREEVRVRVPHAHVRDPRADSVERDEEREPALVQTDVREVRLPLLNVVRKVREDLLKVLWLALRRMVRAGPIGLNRGWRTFLNQPVRKAMSEEYKMKFERATEGGAPRKPERAQVEQARLSWQKEEK